MHGQNHETMPWKGKYINFRVIEQTGGAGAYRFQSPHNTHTAHGSTRAIHLLLEACLKRFGDRETLVVGVGVGDP